MSEAPPRTPLPELSVHVWTFAAEDPGGWQHVLDQVSAADEAGVIISSRDPVRSRHDVP